jgi:hypothetical protein
MNKFQLLLRDGVVSQYNCLDVVCGLFLMRFLAFLDLVFACSSKKFLVAI